MTTFTGSCSSKYDFTTITVQLGNHAEHTGVMGERRNSPYSQTNSQSIKDEKNAKKFVKIPRKRGLVVKFEPVT